MSQTRDLVYKIERRLDALELKVAKAITKIHTVGGCIVAVLSLIEFWLLIRQS